MREPGDEDDDALEPAPVCPPDFVRQCQALIDRITGTQDTSLKQMYHSQLAALLMRKR